MDVKKTNYEKPEIEIIEVDGDVTLNSVDVDFEELE